jgi:hypothetical protein
MKAIASLNQGRLQRRRQVQPDPPLDQAREWSILYDDGQSRRLSTSREPVVTRACAIFNFMPLKC